VPCTDGKAVTVKAPQGSDLTNHAAKQHQERTLWARPVVSADDHVATLVESGGAGHRELRVATLAAPVSGM